MLQSMGLERVRHNLVTEQGSLDQEAIETCDALSPLSPASLPRRMTFLLERTGWEDVEASGDVRIQTGWEVGWTSTSKSIFIDLVVKSERRWRPGIQGRFQKEFLEDSL